MTERPLKTQTRPATDSATEVNPCRSHGVGVWNNRRVVIGVRVDEELYSAFKPVAKRYFGSVCRAIEAYMASVLAVANEGVNFGETVRIENLHVERNLRPRRKLDADACGFRGCNDSVVAVGVWRGKNKLPLCDKHRREAESKPQQWKMLHWCNSLKEERLLP